LGKRSTEKAVREEDGVEEAAATTTSAAAAAAAAAGVVDVEGAAGGEAVAENA
jgi:hypothetical protein